MARAITAMMLYCRMYDVGGGAITIDGTDIRSVNPKDLRGRVLGYIDQEPILFSTSIMENIRYAREEATDEEVLNFISTQREFYLINLLICLLHLHLQN